MAIPSKLAPFLCLAVLAGCHARKDASLPEDHGGGAQVIRTHRLELTDDAGEVRAIVGFQNNNSEPAITLLDRHRNPAVTLRLDKREEATLSFSDPNGPNGGQIDGRVQLGFLRGSDSLPPGEYDPLGSWGIRVLTKNGKGYLSLHDLTLADPNGRDLNGSVAPAGVLPRRDPHAHRR